MKTKKVLHLALLSAGEPNSCMSTAFKNVCKEHLEIDWQRVFNEQGLAGLNNTILQKHREFNPDFVFMQLQREGVLLPATAEEMKKTSFIINWTGDVRENIDWYIKLGKHIDLTLFTNETDVDTLREHGVNADYLQVGYDTNIYNKNSCYSEKTKDIVFLGNNYVNIFPYSQERMDMVNELDTTYGSRFHAFGSNWGTQHLGNKEESVAYNSCKIAINQNHFKHKRFSSDRMFRIMGCGAFCLTNYYPDIEKEFENKNQLVWWKNFDELKSLIDYYLNNEQERNEIAERGYEHTRKYCNWEYRFGIELHFLLNKYKQIK